MKLTKKILHSLLLSLAIVSISVLFIEILLRINKISRPTYDMYYPRYYIEDHPILGYHPKPDFYNKRLDGIIFSNNSLGLRDKEYTNHKKMALLESWVSDVRKLGVLI